jgi:two-component system cell cycle response regulator
VRSEDTVARYGGEEIVVVVLEANLELAVATAERIRAAVAAEEIEARQASVRVTVSVGCAELVETDHDERSLLARADEQVYAAKAAGRNVVKP